MIRLDNGSQIFYFDDTIATVVYLASIPEDQDEKLINMAICTSYLYHKKKRTFSDDISDYF